MFHTTRTADTPVLDGSPVKSALRSAMIAFTGSRWYSFNGPDVAPPASLWTQATGLPEPAPLAGSRRPSYAHALRLARRRLRDRARRGGSR